MEKAPEVHAHLLAASPANSKYRASSGVNNDQVRHSNYVTLFTTKSRGTPHDILSMHRKSYLVKHNIRLEKQGKEGGQWASLGFHCLKANFEHLTTDFDGPEPTTPICPNYHCQETMPPLSSKYFPVALVP